MKLWSNQNVQKNNGGFNPERRLLAAILQRAIADYVFGEGELKESAYLWLFGSEEGEAMDTFAFSYVCEALDFHKEELRKAIQKQYETQEQTSSSGSISFL